MSCGDRTGSMTAHIVGGTTGAATPPLPQFRQGSSRKLPSCTVTRPSSWGSALGDLRL